MLRALVFVYIGWYLGSKGIVTDKNLEQLKAVNSQILADLQAQGIIAPATASAVSSVVGTSAAPALPAASQQQTG